MRTWVGSTPRKPENQSAILLIKVKMSLDSASPLSLTWQWHTWSPWSLAREPGPRDRWLLVCGSWPGLQSIESPYVGALIDDQTLLRPVNNWVAGCHHHKCAPDQIMRVASESLYSHGHLALPEWPWGPSGGWWNSWESVSEPKEDEGWQAKAIVPPCSSAVSGFWGKASRKDGHKNKTWWSLSRVNNYPPWAR